MFGDSDQQSEIEVNGIPIKVSHEKLVASDVLQLAAKYRAISGKPEEYVLESDDPQYEFKSDDWVDLTKYKSFSAEKSGPTPVAIALSR